KAPPPPERTRRRRGGGSGDGNGGGQGDERLRSLRDALRAVRQGDFSVRLPLDAAEDGLFAEVALAFNSVVEQDEALANELNRVAQAVHVEGEISGRASLGSVTGEWAALIASVNTL